MTTPALRIFFSYLLLCCAAPSVGALTPAEAKARHIMEVSEAAVREGLAAFDGDLLDYRLEEAVYRRIVNYLEDWPISSGRVLARSARFYPIFEKELDRAGMPRALRHLSVVESGLRPWATSRVGAGGLWQLMPGTARELGLKVNDELDERLDPALGCAAGLAYLRIQYERYGDWALALAAYNCGPGNVNRAKRRTGKKTYWGIRRRLPRETRNYVPNFIAASYLMTYFGRHGLPPLAIPLDMQVTERIVVHRRISLHRIAQVTGLLPDQLVELNPQYLRGYLPGYRGGHGLLLPSRVVPALREYLTLHPAREREDAVHLPWTSPRLHEGETNGDRFYVAYESVTGPVDTSLRQVAEQLSVDVQRLSVWSGLGEFDTLAAPVLPATFVAKGIGTGSLGGGARVRWVEVKEYREYDPRTRDIPPPTERLPVYVNRDWKVKSVAEGNSTLTKLQRLTPAPAPAMRAKFGIRHLLRL